MKSIIFFLFFLLCSTSFAERGGYDVHLLGPTGTAITTTETAGHTAVDVVCLSGCAGSGGSGGDASAANQVTIIARLQSIIDGLAGTINVSGPLTDAQIRATPLPVSGTFYQATQPVSIASMPSTPVTGTFWQATQPVSGPLTDSQIRATPLPVSGTFWQATQPVSGSVSVSNFPASQAVTGTFWQATQPVSGTFFQATQPVSIASMPSTPVTGTFWQATQPVSGTFFQATQPVSIASMPSTPVTGTFWQATQPVSGTFWQATQPISNANLDVALSTRLKPADTLTGVTTVGAVTSITNALPAGTNRIGSVRPVDSADADLTATKGSQTSRAVGTQDLKDSGRTSLSFYANAVASGTTGTETIFTLTKSSGTSATATGTSFVVTSGKRFRISAINVSSRGHLTATAQITTFSLRMNTAGACLVGSTPILASVATATPATALAWDRAQLTLPDGYEILGDGTLTFCLTANAVFTTNAPTWFVNIIGYEY